MQIILVTLSSSLITGGREDNDEEAVEDQHPEHLTSLNIVNCHSLSRFYEECNIILDVC